MNDLVFSIIQLHLMQNMFVLSYHSLLFHTARQKHVLGIMRQLIQVL